MSHLGHMHLCVLVLKSEISLFALFFFGNCFLDLIKIEVFLEGRPVSPDNGRRSVSRECSKDSNKKTFAPFVPVCSRQTQSPHGAASRVGHPVFPPRWPSLGAYPFIHSFYLYSLNTYYAPGTVTGCGESNKRTKHSLHLTTPEDPRNYNTFLPHHFPNHGILMKLSPELGEVEIFSNEKSLPSLVFKITT